MLNCLPLAGSRPICRPQYRGLAFVWTVQWSCCQKALTTCQDKFFMACTSNCPYEKPCTRSAVENRQITRTQAMPLRTGSLKCTLRQICAEISESQQLRHGPARPCLTLHEDSTAQHARPGEGLVAGPALRRGPCRL